MCPLNSSLYIPFFLGNCGLIDITPFHSSIFVLSTVLARFAACEPMSVWNDLSSRERSSTMRMNLKGLVAAAVFVTLAGAGLASAQSPAAPPRQDPSAPPSVGSQNPSTQQAPTDRAKETTISGELTRVNPDTKMFSVKNATGEIQFRYSDATVVSGAQKTVAGLATMSGEQVTVSYRVEGGTNMATKIEVKEKK
jgi:hypothetical protein